MMNVLIRDRHQRIVDLVNQRKNITNKELLKILYISEATLRRDLDKLSSMGLLTRTHGGAQIKEAANIESPFLIRSQKNVKEKRSIAKAAVDFVKNGDSIFIDSSSTVGHLLPLLSSHKELTFVTNGINNALILSQFRMQQTLYITPGVFNYQTNSLVGIDTVDHIKNYHCNATIFSCGGLSTHGITEANHEQSIVKRAMMKRSKTHILLVDHTKFDHILLSQTCDYEDIDVIITNRMPNDRYIRIFEQSGSRLIVTDE
jgi:DeoR/GlpR family transcriptional regulator of sugar metabolism